MKHHEALALLHEHNIEISPDDSRNLIEIAVALAQTVLAETSGVIPESEVE